MNRRNLLSILSFSCCGLIFPARPRDLAPSILATQPNRPLKMIEFEALGGVGDGDPNTGSGTDNAHAFAQAELIAKQGYGIKFKPGARYKTTKQISAHSMYWVGDKKSSPMIFGWFPEKGQKIIGRSNGVEQISVCIVGLIFHRCGPFAEHGIIIDNIKSLYFDIAVTSRPGAQGGAIGISPFFSENRHSYNCFIKATINNSGDFGVQLGSVSGAIINVTANDCYREVIGIEPIVYESIEVGTSIVRADNILLPDKTFLNGDALLYCHGVGSRGPLTPGKHYFIIVNNDKSISLASSRREAINGDRLSLANFDGFHYFSRAAIVENIVINYARIIDNEARKPSLFANTMGYVIFTGNSGGYMENIKINKLYVEGNQIYSSGKSVGVYVQGVNGLTLDNITVRGCDDAIVVSDGWLNGMFDRNGNRINIQRGYEKILSKNIIIVEPDIKDSRRHGVIFKGNGGSLRGGRFSNSVKAATPPSVVQL